MGLEHLRILVFTAGPGTNPMQVPRDGCISELSTKWVPLILPMEGIPGNIPSP